MFVDPARTGDVRPTRSARPVALLARSVLEECKTLDEAIKLIEGTPTLGAAVFVLVDGSTRQVARRRAHAEQGDRRSSHRSSRRSATC